MRTVGFENFIMQISLAPSSGLAHKPGQEVDRTEYWIPSDLSYYALCSERVPGYLSVGTQ